MLRKVAGGVAIRIGSMIQETAKSLFEVGIFAGRCIYADLSSLRRNVPGNIRTEMQDAFAAVIGLFLMLHATKDAVNERYMESLYTVAQRR